MKVAIIGAGMTGLLAAKAFIDNGIIPKIYTDAEPSPGHGIRYLHDSCGLPVNTVEVETAFVGYGNKFFRWDDVSKTAMAELYSGKTGSSPRNNSVHRSVKTVKAYDWMDAWYLLQGMRVEKHEVVPGEIDVMSKDFDLVVNTAPLFKIYPEAKKSCKSREAYVKDSSPHPNNPSWAGKPDNIIVYNVDRDVNWSRYSRICGVEQTELVHWEPDCNVVTKVDGKSDFVPEHKNVLLMGRYGAWESTYMAHQAYYDTIKAIKEFGR